VASAADRVTPGSAQSMSKWIDAVNRHAPGKPDQPAVDTLRLSYATRVELNAAMDLFERVMREEAVVTRNDAEKQVAELARAVFRNPGRDVFLMRAIVLHGDAAILGIRVAPSPDPTAPPATRVTRAYAPGMDVEIRPVVRAVAPLLTNDTFIVSRDGQVIGDSPSNWNWPFARSLVDLLVSAAAPASVTACRGAQCLGGSGKAASPAQQAFVSAWYHATSSFMLLNGLYAEANPHFRQALETIPNDRLALFDLGCLAEGYGLAMQQVVRADASPQRQRSLGIPPADKTNQDAERWFRRALDVDSTFAEARVRLARLLDVSGRHEQAIAEVQRALSTEPRGTVAFYAHLFGGRAAQALGRLDEARRHYAEALALVPGAQSALLASSQAALLAGDVPAALAPLRTLSGGSDDLTADPWWHYHLGPGRDTAALLDALWGRRAGEN